jgi:hypothetical protein
MVDKRCPQRQSNAGTLLVEAAKATTVQTTAMDGLE